MSGRSWRRPGKRAFTLVEVLIAAAILSVLLVSLLELFSNTQRQAVVSESLMTSGVLAQMVGERLRSNVDSNPRYLRDLIGTNPAWSFTGSVVDPASATAGSPQISPFFEYLFTRESPDLYASANQVAIKPAAAVTATGIKPVELQSLVETFRDHQVSVRIEDDVDLESPAAPTALAGLVKVVTITAARTSVVNKQGTDPLAFTMTMRVITPADSLTDAALDLLNGRFEGPTLSELLTDFYTVAAANPYIQAPQLGQTSKDTVACAFMCVAGANSEGLLVDNVFVPGSTLVDVAADADFIESWITKLTAPEAKDFSSSKAELAGLRRRKATIIFDTFKKIRVPMTFLVEQVLGPIADGSKPLLERVRELGLKLQTDLIAQAAFQAQMTGAVTTYNQQQALIDKLTKDAAAKAGEKITIVYDTTAGTTNTIVYNSSSNTTTTGIFDVTTGVTKTKIESPGGGTTLFDPTTNTTTTLVPPDPNAPDTTAQQLADALAAQQKAAADLAAAKVAYEALLAQTAATVDKDVETVVLASFLQQFFTNADYKVVAARPARYADRFRQTLDDLSIGLESHLDQPTGVTSFERMRAAQGYLEATKARQLERDAPMTDSQARISTLASQFASKEGELSKYLASSEATDLSSQKVRNKAYVSRAVDLRRLAPLYEQVITLLQPSGEIGVFLATYGSYFNTQKPDAEKLLGDIGKVLDGWKKKNKKDD